MQTETKAAPNGWSEVTGAPEIEKGMQTPWGCADSVKELAPGIYLIGTPGHGGYALTVATLARLCEGNAARVNRIHSRLFVHRSKAPYSRGPFYWFEEDCDWAIVCLLIAKNGTLKEKEGYFNSVGEREKEMTDAAWCTVHHFHPTLLEDLRLI